MYDWSGVALSVLVQNFNFKCSSDLILHVMIFFLLTSYRLRVESYRICEGVG